MTNTHDHEGACDLLCEVELSLALPPGLSEGEVSIRVWGALDGVS